MQERKHVVVVGSGYAGTAAARNLDSTPGIDVTMVAPSDFMMHKVAALRAAVKGGNWTKRSMIPTKRVIRNGTFIQSTAVAVNPDAKTITLKNGQMLKYDALVLATGSRSFSPADPPRSVSTQADVERFFSAMRVALTRTRNVVIIGNGSVGLELAAEIREYGQPGAKITVVGRSTRILSDQFTYKESGIKAILSDLAALQVEVINRDEVVSHSLPENLYEAIPILNTPEGITLKSGRKIASDLLVFAVGAKLNTDFLPAHWVDKVTGEVIVDERTLVLPSAPNVFAVGDIAKVPGAKRAYFAGEDAKIVAKNVNKVLAGKRPTHVIKRSQFIALTLGSNGGRTLLSFTTLGPWLTTKLKSKDLFVSNTWKDVAPGVPIPVAD